MKPARDPRTGLRTSATFATIFTLLGHAVFGFEQALVSVPVALITAYATALGFEWIDARSQGRRPGYAGNGWRGVVDFLLSAHMTGITTSFLLYTNERMWVLAFVVAAGIGSKYLLRVTVDGRPRHFMNPSNFGIALGLTLFPWLSMLPWGYTTDLHGAWDWALPGVITLLGIRLNVLFTKRIPLVLAWLGGFVVQGVIRAWLDGGPVLAELAIASNVPMVLFTLYMITDPQTSPSSLRGQVGFGLAVAASYAALMLLHVNYTLFYAVTVATAGRGALLYAEAALAAAPTSSPEPQRSVA